MIQSAHACIDFQHKHPEIAKEWNTVSNFLVMLSVASERDLYKYLYRFESNGFKVAKFHEPDINNELTAITVEPNDKARKMCRHLPLALKEFKKDF